MERVKKIKDYGFVHFEDRDNALIAMDTLNGSVSIVLVYEKQLLDMPCQFSKYFLYDKTHIYETHLYKCHTFKYVQVIGESEVQISLAKPPSEGRQKEKRKREMMHRMFMGRG